MQAGLKQFLNQTPQALKNLASRLRKLADDPYNRRPLSAAEKAAAGLEEGAAQAGLRKFRRAAGAARHTLNSCNTGLVELNSRHLEALHQALDWLRDCLSALQKSQAETDLPEQGWLQQLQNPHSLSAEGPLPARSPSQTGQDLSLDDVAALLVQLGPDDMQGLGRIQNGLRRLADSQPDASQAGELLGTAAEKLEQATHAGSEKAVENLLSEAGLHIDAASDMMEAAARSIGSSGAEETETLGFGHRTLDSPSPQGIKETLQLLNAQDAAENLDLDALQESLQAMSRDPGYPSDVRELLCQAVERCLSFDEKDGCKETLLAEVGLCLDAAGDMHDSVGSSQSAVGSAEPGASAESVERLGAEEISRTLGLGPWALDSAPSLLELPRDADPELIGEFIAESREAIDAAEASLLDLETSPRDMEAVNTVFRSFHTIKGTSAFLGLDIISRLAHLAENLLSRIREQEIVCAGGYADLALRSVDILKELLQGLQDALGGQETPVPEAYRALAAMLEDPEAHGISEESSDAEPPAARLGDILVNLGKAEREEVEVVAASKGRALLGKALVKTGAAKVSDVAEALRSQRSVSGPDASVRVRTEKLDRLIDMVGELVIAHSMVSQDELVLDRANFEMARKVNHAGKIVRELQDLCMSLRMVPMRAVFQKMARLARDLSRKMGKQVEFTSEGEETEIDRNMVDIIGDPLVHMVRNAVDHGIEMPEERLAAGKAAVGRLSLQARHAGGNVIVELKDDGRGLDRGKIAAKAMANGLIDAADGLSDRQVFELIFAPGFSTAQEITDISGRGVGMDVVRRGIESLRGRVQISSQAGKGCTFSIVLPLTLAITDGMLIRVGCERFIIPTVNIRKSFHPRPDSLSTVAGRGEMVLLRDELMPIYRLHLLFDIPNAVQDPTQGILVVVGDGHKPSALLVDELLGQQQVVAKSLDGLGQIEGVSGAAILGDGKVGLILDTAGLVKLAQQDISKPISVDKLGDFTNGSSVRCR